MESKESFVFYRSFYESIKKLDNDTQLKLYNAICEYSLNGEETEDLSPIASAIFTLIKPNVDSANKRYIANIENGKKGGAPKGNQNAKKQPKTTQNNPNSTEKQPKTTQKQPKNNLNVNDNVDVNVNDNYNGECVYNKNNAPELSDIIQFGKELGKDENYCKRFYLTYQNKGWESIHDWKALLEKWTLEDAENKPKKEIRRKI